MSERSTFPTVKRLLLGRPIPSHLAHHERLSRVTGLAVLWSVWRLPTCLKRVGSADRALAHGLIGAAVGFSLWSILHWTIELPAVAISASALGGTWNRWLAGGTDLFVDRA